MEEYLLYFADGHFTRWMGYIMKIIHIDIAS